MHVPIVVGMFVFVSPGLTGLPMVSSTLAWGAALWVIVAAVILTGRPRRAQQPAQRLAAWV